MFLYKSSVEEFIKLARYGANGKHIEDVIKKEKRKYVVESEISDDDYRKWARCLPAMAEVLAADERIPRNATCAIEFDISIANYNIDLAISGYDERQHPVMIAINLYAWNQVEKSPYNNTIRKPGTKYFEIHPSKKIYSYTTVLKHYNANIRKDRIKIIPCSYMTEYEAIPDDELLDANIYCNLNEAPLFTKGKGNELADLIARYIKSGDDEKIMNRITESEIIPAPQLRRQIKDMLDNNGDFLLLGEEDKCVESIMAGVEELCANRGRENRVYIVEGGAGTGKSIIAINLLIRLYNKGKRVSYVTKTKDPRQVFKNMLLDGARGSEDYIDLPTDIADLFKYAGHISSRYGKKYDCLIVDEAHRLTADKNGYTNQIQEIINSSRVSVFFVDDKQIVTANDLGTVNYISSLANHDSRTFRTSLTTQFRCNGSNAYMNFVDHILDDDKMTQVIDPQKFDFDVYDDAAEMRDIIRNKNKEGLNARVVSGCCVEWKSRDNSSLLDFTKSDYGFEAQWNMKSNNKVWATEESGIDQIGCIHTCQGLEFDYIGVIIGEDLKYYKDPKTEKESIIADPAGREKETFSTIKCTLKGDYYHEPSAEEISTIIKNTYRVLMTRGRKGCYVYCADPNLRDYIRRQYSACMVAYMDANEDF